MAFIRDHILALILISIIIAIVVIQHTSNHEVFDAWNKPPGLSLIKAKFYLFEQGHLKPIRRSSILGQKDRASYAAEWTWKIKGLVNLEKTIQLICNTLPKQDIRLQASISTRSGWQNIRTTANNVCLAHQ